MKISIVHTPEYAEWKFSETHPTQGRRFINGFNRLIEKLGDTTYSVDSPRLASLQDLARVHSEEHIHAVVKNYVCNEWEGARPDLARFAQFFVGGTLVALRQIIQGDADIAIHLPGAKHHAQRDYSSGFCVFNDFAIAADIATKEHNLKVAILDIDAHHGDGVENLTADNPDVLTFSIHQSGIYPGTGHENNISKHIYNVPIDPFSVANPGQIMRDAVSSFTTLAKEFGADIVFITAGADGVAGDPLTNLGYSLDDYIAAADIIATNLDGIPLLIGGAGGYLPDTLTPEVWATFINQLVQAKGDQLCGFLQLQASSAPFTKTEHFK